MHTRYPFVLAACIFSVTLTTSADGPYLFSYFKDNGQDGLHLAYSYDGLKWTSLKNDQSFLTPQIGNKLMRDPCICIGSDGTFHMVWTTGWHDKGIGIAHSKDLIHWSEQTWLEVMSHEPDANNCWAPEIYYDAPTEQYFIFWSTTIPGRFPETEPKSGDNKLNHRIYCTTTKNFKTYTDTKLFYDDGFNVIDATIVKDGDTYVMFLKDETEVPVAKKNIRIAIADKAEGPYGHASDPFSPDWVEGPTAIKIGDYWYVYYDAYTRHRYEGARSKDLKTWEPITDLLEFPKGIVVRHGTVFSVPHEVLTHLLNATTCTAFAHPGIMHNAAELAFIKSKIQAGEQPWSDAFKQLQESPYAKLDWEPEPRKHVQRGPYNKPNIGGDDFMRGGAAAYTHAIQWVMTGNKAFAEKAAAILYAWSSTLEKISHHDAKLLVGMAGIQYCNAAELLKHTWDGWAETEQEQFESMLRRVLYPIIKGFYPSANGNWDASMQQTMMAMGVFLDDVAMFERAVEYTRNGKGNGAINHYFNDFGQCQESGRDQGHTQMGLEYLVNACEIAWKQGVDLYSEYDNRLAKGFEYTAKYNLGHEVPFEHYESYDKRYVHDVISEEKRGKLRPIYEKIVNHYHRRKGMDMPWSREALSKTRPENVGLSGLPWSTLMFADLPPKLTPGL